jgi:hypothetical protein
VNEQVSAACRRLAPLKELEGGFNMIGFSQGGQFLRVSEGAVNQADALPAACTAAFCGHLP